MKQIYKVMTENYHIYEINDKQQIIRMDMKFTPSDNWKFVEFVDRYHREVHPEHGKCKYKNGKGKYWLIDYDHGTCRQWGDKITEVWYKEEN